MFGKNRHAQRAASTGMNCLARNAAVWKNSSFKRALVTLAADKARMAAVAAAADTKTSFI